MPTAPRTGFRMIPNSLFDGWLPRYGSAWSTIEMYLDYDRDVFQNRVVSLNSYAKRWGCTWRKSRAVVMAYEQQNQQQNQQQNDSLEATGSCADTDRSDSTTTAEATAQRQQKRQQKGIETETETETEAVSVAPAPAGTADAVTDALALVSSAGYKLSPARLESLRQIRPRGVLYSPGQVAAWFVAKAPLMQARGVKNLGRAAPNWFARAEPKEIDDAMTALENRRFQARFGDRIDAAEAEPKPAPPPAVNGWAGSAA